MRNYGYAIFQYWLYCDYTMIRIQLDYDCNSNEINRLWLICDYLKKKKKSMIIRLHDFCNQLWLLKVYLASCEYYWSIAVSYYNDDICNFFKNIKII